MADARLVDPRLHLGAGRQPAGDDAQPGQSLAPGLCADRGRHSDPGLRDLADGPLGGSGLPDRRHVDAALADRLPVAVGDGAAAGVTGTSCSASLCGEMLALDKSGPALQDLADG